MLSLHSHLFVPIVDGRDRPAVPAASSLARTLLVGLEEEEKVVLVWACFSARRRPKKKWQRSGALCLFLPTVVQARGGHLWECPSRVWALSTRPPRCRWFTLAYLEVWVDKRFKKKIRCCKSASLGAPCI